MDPTLKARIDNHELCPVCLQPMSEADSVGVVVELDQPHGQVGRGEFPIHRGACLAQAQHHAEHDPHYRIAVMS